MKNGTVTECNQLNRGTFCTLVMMLINNFFDTFEKKEINHFSKKVSTCSLKVSLHTINTINKGYSLVKDYLTTAKNSFIYNNISCKGLLYNWVLGVVRG